MSKTTILYEASDEIINAMKAAYNNGFLQIDDVMFDNPKNAVIRSIRYWGKWILPEDAEYEEEDYDWMVLDECWIEKLCKILENVQSKYPELKLTFECGEKKYIFIYVRSRN